MLNSVQITAQAQPHASMMIDEVVEAGDRILPTADGRWTLFSLNLIYSRDQEYQDFADFRPGQVANRPILVTWVAADEVAFQVSSKRYRDEVARQQAAANQPKLALPETPKLIV